MYREKKPYRVVFFNVPLQIPAAAGGGRDEAAADRPPPLHRGHVRAAPLRPAAGGGAAAAPHGEAGGRGRIPQGAAQARKGNLLLAAR